MKAILFLITIIATSVLAQAQPKFVEDKGQTLRLEPETEKAFVERLSICYTNGVIMPTGIEAGDQTISVVSSNTYLKEDTIMFGVVNSETRETYYVDVHFTDYEDSLYQENNYARTFKDNSVCGQIIMNKYKADPDNISGLSFECFGEHYIVDTWRVTDSLLQLRLKAGRSWHYASLTLPEEELMANAKEDIMESIGEEALYESIANKHGFDLEDVRYIYSDFTHGPREGMSVELIDQYLRDEEIVYEYYIPELQVGQYYQVYNVDQYIVFTFRWNESQEVVQVDMLRL